MIQLNDLRDATGGQMFGDVLATEFTRFATDPERIGSGDLFVASGVESDKKIARAIANGAAGVIVEDPPVVSTEGQTVVMVGDARAAMGQWAAYVLRQFGTTVVGVFTALGESTVQATIESVLGTRYHVFSYHYQPDLTQAPYALPDAVQNLTPDHEILVIPLLGQRPSHLADVVAAAQPLVNVVGRVTPIEPISEAEMRRLQLLANVVLEQLPAEGRAVISADDYIAQEALNRGIDAPSVLYGQIDDIYADISATDIKAYPNRSTFTLALNDETHSDIQINLPGPFAIDAALAGLSVGYLFDLTLPEMVPALSNVRLPDHISHMRSFMNEHLLLDFSGETSFTSVLALVEWLRILDLPQQRKALWLGDVSKNFPELYAAEVTVQACSRVLFQGDVARRLAHPLLQSGMDSESVDISYLQADSVSLLSKSLPAKSAILKVGNFADTAQRQAKAVTQIEIDLTQIRRNLKILQKRIKPESKLIADVSDNAYGHGLLAVASTAIAAGVGALSVHSLDEAVQLRQLGITVPVLTTANLSHDELLVAAKNRLHVTLKTPEIVDAIREISWQIDEPILAQILMDVDEGWFGISPTDVVKLSRELIRMQGIKLDGVYAAPKESDDLLSIAKTREKLKLFDKTVKSLVVSGVNLNYIHIDTSSGAVALPESDFGWVNAGITAYGLNSSPTTTLPPDIKPCLTWKTSISQVSSGTYAEGSQDAKPRTIAIIPLGFRDGLPNAPYSWGEALVRGQRVRVLNEAVPHATALDVTNSPEVVVGDNVVLLGQQSSESINAEDVARRVSKPVDVLLAEIPSEIPRTYK